MAKRFRQRLCTTGEDPRVEVRRKHAPNQTRLQPRSGQQGHRLFQSRVGLKDSELRRTANSQKTVPVRGSDVLVIRNWLEANRVCKHRVHRPISNHRTPDPLYIGASFTHRADESCCESARSQVRRSSQSACIRWTCTRSVGCREVPPSQCGDRSTVARI